MKREASGFGGTKHFCEISIVGWNFDWIMCMGLSIDMELIRSKFAKPVVVQRGDQDTTLRRHYNPLQDCGSGGRAGLAL